MVGRRTGLSEGGVGVGVGLHPGRAVLGVGGGGEVAAQSVLSQAQRHTQAQKISVLECKSVCLPHVPWDHDLSQAGAR